MIKDFKFSGSIVVYNSNTEFLKLIITKFLSLSSNSKLYVIDNSPHRTNFNFGFSEGVVYDFVGSNIGFGAGHNKALKMAKDFGSQFHFIINPDVTFDENVITEMLDFASDHSDVGLIMPKILGTDGSLQYLPKLLPSPLSLILRKIFYLLNWPIKFITKYELRNLPDDKVSYIPIISGCFSLLNLKAVGDNAYFDESYFLYFEDWDLSRRITYKLKTVYFPFVSVVHDYQSGANSNLFLFYQFMRSACIYFNKWGWFFDSYRKLVNKKTLNQLNP